MCVICGLPDRARRPGESTVGEFLMNTFRACLTCLSALVVVATLVPSTAEAGPFCLSTLDPVCTLGSGDTVAPLDPLVHNTDWLLVGTSSVGVGEAASGDSGWELGAHLPLDADPGVPTDLGPDVGDVTIPVGAAPVEIGIGGNGDTALLDPTGTFDFQGFDGESLFEGEVGRSGIYGDTGILCAGTAALTGDGGCIAGNSNNYFFDTTGLDPVDYDFPLNHPDDLLDIDHGIVDDTMPPAGAILDPLRAELD